MRYGSNVTERPIGQIGTRNIADAFSIYEHNMLRHIALE